MSPDAIGFVNGLCGEALGASAALCTVNSHCVTSPMLRRGDWVIHFALQALQLHATPPRSVSAQKRCLGGAKRLPAKRFTGAPSRALLPRWMTFGKVSPLVCAYATDR